MSVIKVKLFFNERNYDRFLKHNAMKTFILYFIFVFYWITFKTSKEMLWIFLLAWDIERLQRILGHECIKLACHSHFMSNSDDISNILLMSCFELVFKTCQVTNLISVQGNQDMALWIPRFHLLIPYFKVQTLEFLINERTSHDLT